jgi:hypothetical protein
VFEKKNLAYKTYAVLTKFGIYSMPVSIPTQDWKFQIAGRIPSIASLHTYVKFTQELQNLANCLIHHLTFNFDGFEMSWYCSWSLHWLVPSHHFHFIFRSLLEKINNIIQYGAVVKQDIVIHLEIFILEKSWRVSFSRTSEFLRMHVSVWKSGVTHQDSSSSRAFNLLNIGHQFKSQLKINWTMQAENR